MIGRTALAAMVTSLVAFPGAPVRGPLKSGPQPGESVPGPFHPLVVTGGHAGKKACLYCEYGESPVAAVFARDATPEVLALLKRLDKATAKNRGCGMASYAVFLSDKQGLAGALEKAGREKKLRHLVLAVDVPDGPDPYQIARDADVTVILYSDLKVRANHAFRKGALDGAAVARVVADVKKIIPAE